VKQAQAQMKECNTSAITTLEPQMVVHVGASWYSQSGKQFSQHQSETSWEWNRNSMYKLQPAICLFNLWL